MKKYLVILTLGVVLLVGCNLPLFQPEQENAVREEIFMQMSDGTLSESKGLALLEVLQEVQSEDGIDWALVFDSVLSLGLAYFGINLYRRGPRKPMDSAEIAALKEMAAEAAAKRLAG